MFDKKKIIWGRREVWRAGEGKEKERKGERVKAERDDRRKKPEHLFILMLFLLVSAVFIFFGKINKAK